MNQIHDKIDRYFEARLSQEEEKNLLWQLMSMEGKDPIADEALAVMLASRLTPKANKGRHRSYKKAVGIAASISLLLGIGAILIHQPKDTQSFAYVSGKKIKDPNEIKKIITTQLNDIGESSDFFSQTISTDLEDISEALISDDI